MIFGKDDLNSTQVEWSVGLRAPMDGENRKEWSIVTFSILDPSPGRRRLQAT